MISEKDKSKVKDLFIFMLDYNIEIVSYGLPPNPSGFCVEFHQELSENIKNYVFDQLNSLNENQEEYLRSMAF